MGSLIHSSNISEFTGNSLERGLSGRYAARLVPWVIAILALASFFAITLVYISMTSELDKKGKSLSALYATALAQPVWEFHRNAVVGAIAAFSTDPDVHAVVVKSGGRVYRSGEMNLHEGLLKYQNIIHSPLDKKEIGHVEVYISRQAAVNRTTMASIVAAGFILLLVLTIIFISNRIQRNIILNPLQNLLHGMVVFSPGKAYQRLTVQAPDEIGLLTQKFNSFAESLSDNFNRLEHLVAQRTQELVQANSKLEHLATIDELTQIYNRRKYQELIEAEWKRHTRSKLPLSVILCDVDHFKLYNDGYGHQAGDDCLHKVAQAIAKIVKRPTDIVARYGGEEFIIVLPETGREGALAMAESIRKAVADLNIEHAYSRSRPYLTVSLGVSSAVPSWETSYEKLVSRSDQALYHSKSQGRNRITFSPFEVPSLL
jgi:diguanylate cyclase (GGDEF)-like protein